MINVTWWTGGLQSNYETLYMLKLLNKLCFTIKQDHWNYDDNAVESEWKLTIYTGLMCNKLAIVIPESLVPI